MSNKTREKDWMSFYQRSNFDADMKHVVRSIEQSRTLLRPVRGAHQ
jgi:hypothetical protein